MIEQIYFYKQYNVVNVQLKLLMLQTLLHQSKSQTQL